MRRAVSRMAITRTTEYVRRAPATGRDERTAGVVPFLAPGLRIAVLIPCYNEAATIGRVVEDFRVHLPDAQVYVYDNNSSDGTRAAAESAGARVYQEHLQGKGHVVRRMFGDVDADIYLLVDGDATYEAEAAGRMIKTLIEHDLDMVNGIRRDTAASGAYRPGHRLGNRLLTGIVSAIFGQRTLDMLSGYRALSRRYVKSFTAFSSGFEIETEMTVHALELDMPVMDVETRYVGRPDGSESKLNTYRDGWRILRTIAALIRDERPFLFFSAVALFLFVTGVTMLLPVLLEYMGTGLVPRFPTLFVGIGLVGSALLCFVSGVILDTVTRGRREMKRLFYLQQPSIKALIGAADKAVSSTDRA